MAATEGNTLRHWSFRMVATTIIRCDVQRKCQRYRMETSFCSSLACIGRYSSMAAIWEKWLPCLRGMIWNASVLFICSPWCLKGMSESFILYHKVHDFSLIRWTTMTAIKDSPCKLWSMCRWEYVLIVDWLLWRWERVIKRVVKIVGPNCERRSVIYSWGVKWKSW